MQNKLRNTALHRRKTRGGGNGMRIRVPPTFLPGVRLMLLSPQLLHYPSQSSDTKLKSVITNPERKE